MSVLTIPTTNDPFQKQTVKLDGRQYVLTLTYNQREERFYLSIADDEGKPLLSGIKLVCNWPLLFRHRYNASLPSGELYVFDTTANQEPPTLDELGEGKRCELTYLDAAEMAAL